MTHIQMIYLTNKPKAYYMETHLLKSEPKKQQEHLGERVSLQIPNRLPSQKFHWWNSIFFRIHTQNGTGTLEGD